MGHRLSRITTRTGDKGTTGLANGLRVDKDSPRVLTMGAVDELNSCTGVVLSHATPSEIRDVERFNAQPFSPPVPGCSDSWQPQRRPY